MSRTLSINSGSVESWKFSVRCGFKPKLGFSKEYRGINIRRIGYVASEITKNGGIAICAPIAPYDAVRKQVRQMIEPWESFVLV